MRNDPAFREALSCIRCGACSNVCPSYQVVGGHVFGHIYTGPIGLVVSPFHHGLDSVANEQQMCMGCNACDTVCPVEIPLAALISDVRAKAVERMGMPLAKRVALSQWRDPERIDRATSLLSTLQRPLRRGSLIRLPMVELGREKSLPAVAERPLHYRAREITQSNPATPTLRVGLFPSCIIDHFLPNAGYAAARVLQALGADVHLVEGRRCCGLPQLNSGDRQHAREMAKEAIAALETVQADRIVAPSSSCAITMSDDYVRLFADDPEWGPRAKRLAERMRPFTSIAYELACGSDVRGRKLEVRATYHDACQSANVLGLHDQPRELLKRIAGIELAEMADSAVCCGFGGTFSFEFPEVATFVLDKKLANIAATRADVVITDNPGCLTHLKGGLDARGKTVKVRHLAEILWESLTP
jgi:L-lactate dehydrogenase complex protein LldF